MGKSSTFIDRLMEGRQQKGDALERNSIPVKEKLAVNRLSNISLEKSIEILLKSLGNGKFEHRSSNKRIESTFVIPKIILKEGTKYLSQRTQMTIRYFCNRINYYHAVPAF